MADILKLEIVTPEGKAFSEEVEMVWIHRKQMLRHPQQRCVTAAA